jgi:hypothetical protein
MDILRVMLAQTFSTGRYQASIGMIPLKEQHFGENGILNGMIFILNIKKNIILLE